MKCADKIARELCSNLLIHREFSSGITSRIIITKESIYTENPNMPRMRGFITINNCIPYSKNPKIAKIFREIGLADELGSGVRNITNYSEIYSGKQPVFEEGDIFKATVLLKAQDELITKIISFCKNVKLDIKKANKNIILMEGRIKILKFEKNEIKIRKLLK